MNLAHSDLATQRTLQHMEDDAHRYWKNAVENWLLFFHTVIEIQNSGEWKQRSQTWEAYCAEYMPVSDSRIRQFRMAKGAAERIATVTGVTPPERYIRMLRKEFADDDPMLITAYTETLHFAASVGKTPTQADFSATRRVLNEAQQTGGYLDTGETGQIHMSEPEAIQNAITYERFETMQRQKDRIREKSHTELVKLQPVGYSRKGDIISVSFHANDVLNVTEWLARKPKAAEMDKAG